MRGKVAEKGSGRPISAAIVSYHPHRTANDGFFRAGGSRPVETVADGSFELPVLPRRGYLIVQAPNEDYVLHELDEGLLIYWSAGNSARLRPRVRRLRSETGRGSQGGSRREGRYSAGRHRERPGRRAGRPAGRGCLDARVGSTSAQLIPCSEDGAANTTAPHATAGSSSTGSIPIPRYRCRFLNPSAGSARPSTSLASWPAPADCRQARAVRHGLGPAGRPGR